MKRKLNLRFLGLLVVITCVGALGIHILHGKQVHRSIDDYLRRVGDAEAKGDVTAASRYLRVYLSFRPNDYAAMSRYALFLCDNEARASRYELEEAAKMIDLVLMRDKDNPDLRRRLARLNLNLGRVSDARTHLKQLVDQSPRDSELHYMLGEAEQRLGDFAKAAQQYESAYVEDPHNVAAYSRHARVLRTNLKEPEKADKIMDAGQQLTGGIVNKNPDSSLAWLERAWYRRDYFMPGALEDVQKSIALAPNDLQPRLLAAELLSDLKPTPDLKTARAHIAFAIDKFPKDSRPYLTGAKVELRGRDIDAAVARLKAGNAALPDDLTILWTFVDLSIQAGRLEGMPEQIDTLRSKRLLREVIDYLDAQLLYARGQWSEASRALERVGKSLGAIPELDRLAKRTFVRLGECYDRLGNVDLRLNAYQRAVNITPLGSYDDLAVTARNGLAAALVAQGRIDRAIEEFRKNLLLPEATEEMRLTLARLLIFRNLRLPEASRRWDEVETLLNTAAKRLPDSTEVTVLRAETFTAQKQLNRAQELLTKVRDEHPEKVELWVALSVLAMRQDRSDDAMQILNDAEKKLGDKADIRIARSRYWSTRGGADAVANIRKLAQDAQKFSQEERYQLVNNVAEALVRLGEIKTAMAYWDQLSREQPNNLLMRMYLFDATYAVGTDAEIQTAIDSIHQIEGEDGSLWRFCKARLLMRQSPEPRSPQMSQARLLLNEIATRRPAWPRAPLSIAEIDDAQDNADAALKNYQRAINLGDRSPQAIRRTVQLLYRIRRYDQADQVLRQLQEEMPISTEMQRLAADVSLQTRDYSRALDLARRAVSKDSAEYGDHLWLGQLLLALSRKEENDGRKTEASARRAEAETSLRRSVELGRTKSETWVSLIQFLSDTNNIAAAEKAIEEAEKAIPATDRALPLATANELIGRTQRAEILFKQAVEDHPDDAAAVRGLASFYVRHNRIEDAQKHLVLLIEMKSSDAAWAKRILALALQQKGHEQLALKALDVLNEPGQEVPVNDNNSQDMRVKARVFALQRNRDRRREAIRLLEAVGLREAPLIEDRVLLGQLYENDGNWNKARDQYSAAIAEASGQEKLPALAPLARGLLTRKHAEEARPFVTQIRDLAPQAPVLAEFDARLAVLEGKPDRAATIIRDFVKDKDSQLLICAVLLEELAIFPASEELYRRYAALPGQPLNVLVLAEYLGRRGRTNDALDVCEPAWKTLGADKVSVASLRILYAGTVNQDACDRVANHIDQASKADPKALSLLFDLANVRSLQGRYGEAEQIFRDVYGRDQTNVNPLNNLAWILSMQDGKSSQALETIDRAISVSGAIPEFLDTRGVIHLAMGRADLAVKELEDSVAVSPSSDGYFHLARAYVAAKRVRDATDALQEARNLGLKPDTLHPLERPAYNQLIATLPRAG